MAFEEKYKTIKPKYDLLKDAFKQLYGEHDGLKAEIGKRNEEFERLNEDYAKLRQEYDLLIEEIKDTKLQAGGGSSSWIERIKKNVEASLTDPNIVASLNDEVASLKSKLETALGDNGKLYGRTLTEI
ncbi:hypothetical protein BEWA_031580 [Theileria equi strain WA]|uniref:Uncharacterized protein n=1 Tax=Theileria equi strain WA TaxID=1537102 RepID=L0AXL2_THEEQ|nr:hypothetical protein BEWA_031580 [Theileria equi strain WA]AFZ80305.1 hypothetical protein BEWA_031580 [Theileria equi strain WA]|eukprot:XP_004829971.1 hypothetical protein BEWA_031580 [Theileria equi strain WA]